MKEEFSDSSFFDIFACRHSITKGKGDRLKCRDLRGYSNIVEYSILQSCDFASLKDILK